MNPKGNNKDNPFLPDSFTQIYTLFPIGFRIGPPKMHRRFCIGLHKIHRRFHGSTSMASKFFVCLNLSNICYFSEGLTKNSFLRLIFLFFGEGQKNFFWGGGIFSILIFFIFFWRQKKLVLDAVQNFFLLGC